MTIRLAQAADTPLIAALHALSWQVTYRGSLTDAYLDGVVVEERRTFWAARMADPPAGLLTLVDDRAGALAGFVCALIDQDRRWGTLIDNLHADPSFKRQGIGRALMVALGQALQGRGASGPVHLFVLDANVQAAAFYGRLGGETVESFIKTEPDGSPLPVSRIAWPSVADFQARVGA